MDQHMLKFTKGDLVYAIENIEPTDKNFLCLNIGNTLVIEEIKENPSLFLCRSNSDGKLGLVEKKYLLRRSDISVTTKSWFWGKISREKANELLQDVEPGSFLVRESFTNPSQVLCVKTPSNEVRHFLIQNTASNKVTLGITPEFENVVDLIEYHRLHSGNLGFKLTAIIDRNQIAGFSHDSLIATLKKAGWWINIEAIKMGVKIGSGQFGDVFRVTVEKIERAAKILKNSNFDQETFLREAMVMSELHHQSLVEMLGVSKSNESLMLIMELCEKGTLHKYLTCQGRKVVTHDKIHQLSIEICRGMAYLESKKIVHRDLSARNVLLTDAYSAKITDFGMAIKSRSKIQKQRLPVRWTAPEALKKKLFSSKSDVWSFGIVLWECYTYGRLPYSLIPNDQIDDYIMSGNIPVPPEDCPPRAREMMMMCWNIDSQARPTFAKLLGQLELAKK